MGAWAKRRKVKDTWGPRFQKGGKLGQLGGTWCLGDAVVGVEELWESIIVS